MRKPDPSADLSFSAASTTSNGGAGITRSLALQGRRLTGPRQAIINFVAPRRDHFSAQEVWEELRGTQKGVGRATVFRTLELLAEVGVIDRVHAGDGPHRYAVCEPRHHHHLVCLDCSTVALVVATEIEQQIRRIALAEGFELLTHHVELMGRCATCRGPDGQPADRV